LKVLVAAVLAVAVAVPVALGANGDPQRKPTKAGQARAKLASVTSADVGPGWTGTTTSKSNSSNPRCANYHPDQSALTEIGHFDSPEFSRPDHSLVESTTGVFKSVAQAKTAFTRVATDQIAPCFAQLLAKQVGSQGKLTVTGYGPLRFPSIGDASRAYGIRANFTAGATRLVFAIDFVLFNRGSTDVALVFLALGKPLPAAFEQHVASLVAARAK
jgi:hypothetical protein